MKGYPEKTIGKVFDEEIAMYRHHSREGDLPLIRHLLIQQLLQQDTILYKLAVTLRADGNFKLMSLPLQMNQVTQVKGNPGRQAGMVQIAIQMEDANQKRITPFSQGARQTR